MLRPLVDPIPLYAWSMAWRRGSASAGIAALRDAAVDLGTQEDWLSAARERTSDTWIPEPEGSHLASGDLRLVSSDARRVSPTRRATRTR